MNSVGSNNVNYKFRGFKPSGWKDKGIIKYWFAATTQFILIWLRKSKCTWNEEKDCLDKCQNL